MSKDTWHVIRELNKQSSEIKYYIDIKKLLFSVTFITVYRAFLPYLAAHSHDTDSPLGSMFLQRAFFKPGVTGNQISVKSIFITCYLFVADHFESP